MPQPQQPWTDEELEASVDLYLLITEHRREGTPIVLTHEYDRVRRGVLSGRSQKSVEYRLCNISAVVESMGLEWTKGFAPARSVGEGVKARIRTIIEDRLGRDPDWDTVVAAVVKLQADLGDKPLSAEQIDSIRPAASNHMVPSSWQGPDNPAHLDGVLPTNGFHAAATRVGLVGVCTGRAETKRLYLCTPEVARSIVQDSEPTDDRDELDRRVERIRHRGPIERPPGSLKPERNTAKTTTAYHRDPEVKAWVLQEAKGFCELCGAQAPFLTGKGNPYLEVHHVKGLADGGPDTTENTVALCPNCHRKVHYGEGRDASVQKLYATVGRLVG